MAGEEDLLKLVMEKLMEANKAKDWAVAMEKRAEAVKLIKNNLSVVRYVNVTQLGQKLRTIGFSTDEVQKIIRGVSLAQRAVAAGEVTAGVGTGAAVATEAGTFITIAGVSLTAAEAAVVAGVILAVLVGCIAVGWALSKLFFGSNNDLARITVNEYAHPYRMQSRFLGVVH